MSRPAGSVNFTVVICTRNRPDKLGRTLVALASQTRGDFPIVVVDQSDSPDPVLDQAAATNPRVTAIRDSGRGVSRARNMGWRAATSTWTTFLDDDCVPERDWAEQLARALAEHPEVQFVSGNVVEPEASGVERLPVSVFEVSEEQTLHGRWTPPWKIGLGVFVTIRRDALERLGGFDERLGPGAPDFPAAEDMDLNYRFLRSGGTAYLTPQVRAVHEQWRSESDLGPLFSGYQVGWCAMAMKHLRGGDVRGGLWLWWAGLLDALRMLASSLRRRSRLRFKVAWWKLSGLVAGTGKGIVRRW